MGELMKCYTAICLNINDKTFKIKKGCVEPIYENCRPLMCGFNYEEQLCNICNSDMCNLKGNETNELTFINKTKEKDIQSNKQKDIVKMPIAEKPKEIISNEPKNQKLINCLIYSPFMDKQRYAKCPGGVCYVQRCVDKENTLGYWYGCIKGKTEFDCFSIGCGYENTRGYIPKSCFKCSDDYCNG
ncbi:hypothetical protein Mgra_00008704, partial [Meloidogyne graminicola]